MNEYNLTAIPEHVVCVLADKRRPLSYEIGWSGDGEVPAIGTQVDIKMNNLGSGRVKSYFVENRWLGVCVQLDNAPEWHVRQNAGTEHAGHALVFGAEITVCNPAKS